MRNDKVGALILRKSGKSYNEIEALLGIPKSTLSGWLKRIRWSEKVKHTLSKVARGKITVHLQQLNAIRKERLIKLYRKAREEAEREFRYFKLHPTFIAALSIYWGEGERTSREVVRIANTDPSMIRLFVVFLRKICGIPLKKIRAHVLLYPDLVESDCKLYWIKHSLLRPENFNKCVLIKGRHKTRRLPYGVCYITVSSTYLKEKMRIWLTLLPQEFIKKEYYAGVV